MNELTNGEENAKEVRVCIPRYLQIGKGSGAKLPEILRTIGVSRPLSIVN